MLEPIKKHRARNTSNAHDALDEGEDTQDTQDTQDTGDINKSMPANNRNVGNDRRVA